MTGLVPLLVPAVMPAHGDVRRAPLRGSRRPLPLPTLPPRRARTTLYGLALVDKRGRVADRTVVRALGWTDTTRLDLRIDAGRLLIIALPDGRHGLASRDRVPLPAYLRRGCGIEPGDRVLLAAEPTDGILTIHPLASLDAMLNATDNPTPSRHAS